MNRLFTFGCSMTRYHYPTWADILGTTFDYHENWGKPSSGNEFIFNSIIECDKRNTFTSNDTVVIMWTSLTRIDFYQFNEWNSVTRLLPKSSNDQLIPDIKGYELKTYSFIDAINTVLKSKNVNVVMLSWAPHDVSSVKELYKNIFNDIIYIKWSNTKTKYKNPEHKTFVCERLYNRLKSGEWPPLAKILDKSYHTNNPEILYFLQELKKYSGQDNIWVHDRHPLPLEHLSMAMKHFPTYVSNETIKWVEDINYKLLNGILFDFYPKNFIRF